MKPIFVLYPSELHLLKVSKYQKIFFLVFEYYKKTNDSFCIILPLPLMEEKCKYLLVFWSISRQEKNNLRFTGLYQVLLLLLLVKEKKDIRKKIQYQYQPLISSSFGTIEQNCKCDEIQCNFNLRSIHNQRRQFFRIFDTPLPHVGSFLALFVCNFGQSKSIK